MYQDNLASALPMGRLLVAVSKTPLRISTVALFGIPYGSKCNIAA
jgi:hypothetical protein